MNLKECKEVVFKGLLEEKNNRKICNCIIIPEMKEKNVMLLQHNNMEFCV